MPFFYLSVLPDCRTCFSNRCSSSLSPPMRTVPTVPSGICPRGWCDRFFFTGALVVARAHPGPGGQMAFARELVHVAADLRQYPRRGVLSYARYRLQQLDVQRLFVGPQVFLDTFVQFFDHRPPVPDTGPYGREHEPVVLGQVLPARLHLSVAQFYQFFYILLAID